MKAFHTSVRMRTFSVSLAKPNDSPSSGSTDVQNLLSKGNRLNISSDVAAQQVRDQNSGAAPSMRPTGLQAPLLIAVNTAETSSSHLVDCNGVKGTLTVYNDGGIHFKPLEKRSVLWCSLCGRQNTEPEISGWHVVGAALESPNSFRVWYCTPTQPIPPSSSSSSTKPGSTPHPRFKLQKTLPFTCSSGSEATALVQAVRQAAAWHGRQAAPRVLAVINPKSGQGRAERVFERQVLPVLQDAAGMSVSSMVTSGPGAATELLSQLDLSAVDLLLFVGGDGTVYEGLQGLLSRPDWDVARRVPIAHVPGGSGNGLAHSCGLRDPHTAAFAICKAVVSPMDVASVLQPPASRQYIMLSVAYGSLANLDINTERFRWMGDLRFTLGALWEVLFKGDKYSASIAWLPADAAGTGSIQPSKAAAATSATNGHTAASTTSSSSSTQPYEADSSVVIDSAVLQSKGSSTAAGPGLDQLPVSSERLASVTTVLPDRFPGPTTSLQDFPQQGPELPLLQQLGRLPVNVPSQEAASSVLPPGWRVWHDPLQLFAVVNPPYISATSQMNPKGGLHTGHFNMLLYEGLPGFMGRVQGLAFLAKAESGSHLDSKSLIQDKVRAMIFAPRDYGTYLELDGELVPHVPIYMEVHPGLLQVVISPAHPDEPAAEASRQQFARQA